MKRFELITTALLLTSMCFLVMPIKAREGKSLGAIMLSYQPHGPIVIESNNDFVTQGWPGNGSETNPYLISNLNITSESNCISIIDTSVYFTIQNCLLESTTGHGIYVQMTSLFESYPSIRDCRINGAIFGVYAKWSDGIEIVNVTAHNCQTGIYLFDSDSSMVDSCSVYDSYGGISVDQCENVIVNSTEAFRTEAVGISVYGKNVTVTRNNVYENRGVGIHAGVDDVKLIGNTVHDNRFEGIDASGQGIQIVGNLVYNNRADGITTQCQYIKIVDNLVYSNQGDGITTQGQNTSVHMNCVYNNSGAGIVINEVFYIGPQGNLANLTFNRVFSNAHQGIDLRSGSWCKIGNNSVYCNMEHGIWLRNDTLRARVFSNLVGWNGYKADWTNARNDGVQNTWRYNLWSDYNNVSGFHTIGGYNIAVDNFPTLLVDTDSPTIEALNDIDIEYGSTVTLTYHPHDQYPHTYSIEVLGRGGGTFRWFGAPIAVTLGGLSPGTYEFLIYVYDGAQNNASDRVILTVLAPEIPDQTIDPRLVAAITAGGVLLLVVVILVRRRGQ